MGMNISKTLAATAVIAATSFIAAPAHATGGDLAIDLLDDITIAEEQGMDTYDRDSWAPSGWVDADGTGCTTQEDILIRDTEPESQVIDDCSLTFGTAVDPYSGEFVEHDRDAADFNRTPFDIDHIVPVGEAHRSGGADWDADTKQAFYQDKENLLAVIASENQSKSDADVNNYLPPNQALYCDYVATNVLVKHKYDLTMDQAEHDVAASVLSDEECADTIAQPAVAMSAVDADAVDTSQGADSADADSIALTDYEAAMDDPMGWAQDNPVPAIGAVAVVIIGIFVARGVKSKKS
ncbi:hypothetical protein GCM10009720_16490 [Yaniella flava]|uniref:GmrSD restriction endonucleases C-terminal domain-containing protein n=2 Tax=Yaniella flava TaxID=287930 RepID=A0ABP5G0M5_9MICC